MNILKRTGAVLALGMTLSSSALCQWTSVLRYHHDDGNDSANCIAIDGFSNTYVAGTVTSDDQTDVTVCSYDFLGNMRTGWPRTYIGSAGGDEHAAAIHIDEDGYVYVGGSSFGGSTNGFDFFVWKLAPNGDRVWPNSGTYSGYQFDGLGALRTTSTLNEGYIASVGAKVDMAVRRSSNPANRSIAITGVAQAQSGQNEGYWRTILFQQKTTGTPVEIFSGWPQDKNGGPTKDDFPEAIAVDATNAVAVTGLAYDTTNTIQNFRTIRYTSNGTEDWIYDWAEGNEENKDASGTDIVLDRSGNVYATGYIEQTTPNYATIRIPWDWDGDPDNLEKGIWDGSGTNDFASSIDLTYEVEGGVIKPYIYVTGKSSSTYYNIVTIRYSHHTSGNTLTNVWTDIYLATNSVDDIGDMIVGAGYGNCYVIGKSNDNYILLGLRRNGTHRISPVIVGGNTVVDQGLALAMAGAGLVHLTGESTGSGTALDYLTLADSQDIESSSPYWDYVEVGTEESGDMEDLEASDNAYKVYTRYHEDVATEVLMIEYEGTSAISYANHPSELTVRIEGKCSVAPVTMKVELWNAVTSQYDDFGTLPVTTSDSERIVVVKDDPLAYINSSSSMAIRLSFLETVGQSTLWTYSVDRIVWEVLED